MCVVLCTVFMLSAQSYCYQMTVCSCTNDDDDGKCCQLVQCLAETVTVNSDDQNGIH